MTLMVALWIPPFAAGNARRTPRANSAIGRHRPSTAKPKLTDRGTRDLPKKTAVRRDDGAARPQGPARRSSLCDSEACRAAAALRFAARARRRDEELGGDARAESRSRRETSCRPRRGPSDRIQHVRGHHPARRIWRRHRHDLGSRHLDSRGRSAQRLRQGPSGFRSQRREAARPLASGAHACARRRAS